MNVCVVGGSGYIGGCVAAYLKAVGHRVTLAYRTEPQDPGRVMKQFDDVMRGDVTDPRFIIRLAQSKFDALLYCVSLNHFRSQENILDALNVNVKPLAHLASLLAATKEFKRLIYFSTIQVHGSIKPGESVSEDRPAKPLNYYGLTHLMCEQALACFRRSQGLDAISIRLANGYGAPAFPSSDCWWLVVNDLCKSAVSAGVIKLKSDGTPQRDFIHVTDVARAVELLLGQDFADTQTVNLASGETFTILELAHAVAKVALDKYGKVVPVILPHGNESKALLNDEVAKFKIRTTALDDVGFRTSISLKDGIEGLMNYLIHPGLAT